MVREFTLNVNGHRHRISAEPETPLLYILRNDLGFKSAKFACGLEQCGACKVIIDGQAVPSCRLSVRSVQGKEITTLEGLGTRENLHPIQQAFIENNGIQCGYCTPGMVMAAKALLLRNPDPSVEEIRQGIQGNLCRCTGYQQIIASIQSVGGQQGGAGHD